MLRNKICFILLASLFVTGLAGCGGGVSTSPSGAALTAISITPTNPAIAKDTAQQFTATGIYSDNTKQDLTDTVTWSSSDTTVATVSGPALSSLKTNNGNAYAYGKSGGKTTISATSGSTSGSTTLTVTLATLVSIAVTPATASIAQGTTKQFKATGTFSDNTTQDLTLTSTWASSNTGVATINAGGLATSVAAGTTTITVTSGSVAGSTTLTVTPATLVSIAVTPATASITQGTTKQFKATGTFSDSTTQDLTAASTWSSSNTGVATVSNAAGSYGLATAVAAGTATITATSGGVSATAALTVTAITTGSATLSWNAPTTNTDGTPLTDLAGYKVHMGTSSGNYTTVVDIGNVTTYAVSNLAPGTYYFVVTAYDSSSNESNFSNEASKTI